MSRFQRYIFTLVLAFGLIGLLRLPVSSAAADIELTVSLDRDTIGLDEEAALQIEISGSSQNLPEPQIPSLPTFEMYSQGRSMNFVSENGKMSTSVTYRFVLRPKKAGTFPIDNIAAVQDNKRYKGNRVELTVLNKGTAAPKAVEDQAAGDDGTGRDYFFTAEVDKTNPYVNEQVTLSLKFYIAVQFFQTPDLTEPTTTGFWTEVLGNSGAYNQRINGRQYRVIERKYALFPTQTGDLTIGRARIQTVVASKNRRSRDSFDAFGGFFGRGENVNASTQPIVVHVKPLPDKGRPDDFSGTIGRFVLTATADKTEVEVNQPVTVTFQIAGAGNIKAAAEPAIPDLPDFRVYRASSDEQLVRSDDVLGGTRTFEEVFIPNRPGLLEIPAIELTYFNPETETYARTATKPITINVTKPEGWVAGSPSVPYSGSGLTISSEARDIRYISENPGDLKASGQLVLFRPLYVCVNSFPVLVLAGLVALRWRRDRMAANVGYARSRGASREARKRLAKAKSLAQMETVEAFYAEISQALTSYIADKLNLSPHGLTTDRIRQMLTERGADVALIGDLNGMLQQCDFARFAPASLKAEDIAPALDRAATIITRMEGVRFA